MKSNNAPQLVVDTLNAKERNERLKNIFYCLERSVKNKPYKEYPPQMAAHKKLFEYVNRTIDESKSAKAHNDMVLSQTIVHKAFDGLLNLLKEKEHIHTAPTVVYTQLLYVLTELESYIDRHRVAEYLYYKRNCVTVQVLITLMQQNSRMDEYPKALAYFEKNAVRFQNSESEYDSLHEEYLRIKIAQGRCAEVISVCMEQLRTRHQISYNQRNKAFFKNTEEITSSSNLLSNRHLHGLFVTLTHAFLKKKGKTHVEDATLLAELLQATFPDDYMINVLLSQCYIKQGQQNKTLELYADYLEKFPDHTRMCISCMIYLIKSHALTQASTVYKVFIHHYTARHQNTDVQRLQLLYAWFLASPEEGKELFIALRRDFPDHAMIAYAAIRYAIKIRDRAWLETLKEEVQKQFLNTEQIVVYVQALSEVRLISAAIENVFFTPEDILSGSPKYSTNYRQYRLPRRAEAAFQHLCSCARQPCESNCLDKVFLTGSALDEIIDWNLAIENGTPFDIDRKLRKKDFDFIAIVDEIPEQSPQPGFERCPPPISNVFRYHDNDISIDVSYYSMAAGKENDACDIQDMLKKHGVLLHRRMLMDYTGRTEDYSNGKAFWAYDNRIIALHGDPNKDATCVLRIAKAAIEKQVDLHHQEAFEKADISESMKPQAEQEELETLDLLEELNVLEEDCPSQETLNKPNTSKNHGWTIYPALEKSLYLFAPPFWLESTKLRKPFLRLLTQRNNEIFFSFMKKYQLFCPKLSSSSVEDCLQKIVNHFREQGNLNVIVDLIKKQEQNCEAIENDIEKLLLEQKIQRIKQELIHTKKLNKKLQEEIERKEVQYEKTIEKKLKAWKKDQLPQMIENDLKQLKLELNFLEKNFATEKRQYRDYKQSEISCNIKNAKLKSKISELERLIGIYHPPHDAISDETNHPINASKGSSSVQETTQPLLALDLDLGERWSGLTTDDTLNVARTCFDPIFSAFLYLNLGCKCLYRTDQYREAWLYFKLAETRLHMMDLNPQMTLFLKETLSPLLQDLYKKGKFASIDSSELLNTVCEMDKETEDDVIKIWICILYSLSCENRSKHQKYIVLQCAVTKHRELMLWDFPYYLSLCDLALDLDLLNPDAKELIKITIIQEITSKRMSPHLYMMTGEDLNSLDAWLNYIQQSHHVPKFPHVQQILQQTALQPPIGVIPLLKMSLFSNRQYAQYSLDKQFGFLNMMSVSHIHIAEVLASNRQYASAIAHYQIMIKEISKIKLEDIFSHLYRIWAEYRMYMLKEKQRDTSAVISIVPLFEQMISTWKLKDGAEKESVDNTLSYLSVNTSNK